jgi:hypothetical protein
MRFDDKYPNAQPMDVPEPGILKGKYHKTCQVCGVRTTWMDLDLSVTVCSEECLGEKMLDYARSGDPILHQLLRVVVSGHNG